VIVLHGSLASSAALVLDARNCTLLGGVAPFTRANEPETFQVAAEGQRWKRAVTSHAVGCTGACSLPMLCIMYVLCMAVVGSAGCVRRLAVPGRCIRDRDFPRAPDTRQHTQRKTGRPRRRAPGGKGVYAWVVGGGWRMRVPCSDGQIVRCAWGGARAQYFCVQQRTSSAAVRLEC
jgi:hypothetical protein